MARWIGRICARRRGRAMSNYNGWPLLDSMPDGWTIDKNAGSPVHGYVFVTNGKSVLNGQKRALLRIVAAQRELALTPRHEPVLQPVLEQKKNDEPRQKRPIYSACAKTVNELARAKFKERLLRLKYEKNHTTKLLGWVEGAQRKQAGAPAYSAAHLAHGYGAEKHVAASVRGCQMTKASDRLEKAAKSVIAEFCKKHGVDLQDEWRDPFAFNELGNAYLSLEDMYFDLKNDLPIGMIYEWYFASVDAVSKGVYRITLNSWSMGMRYE